MEKKNSVILRHAKGVLMTDGWVKGTIGGDGTPHCVLGAFAVAHGWVPNEYAYEQEGNEDTAWLVEEISIYANSPAAQAFGECITWEGYDEGEDRIINWNDSDDRTREDVMAALEACAVKEEAEGR